MELRDITGAPRNFLDTALTITDTSGLSRTVALTQYSPGIYGATVSGLTEGVYSLHVAQASSDTKEPVSALSTGLVVPYPGEFRLPDPDDVAGSALLTDLAQIGGGTELTITQPAAAFTHDITAQPQRVQLWPWLLLAAIIPVPDRHCYSPLEHKLDLGPKGSAARTSTRMRIDLNCDMGEGFGPWRMGRDEEIMPYITSANVACGAHAGDPNVMTATIRLAKKHGVAVGAHPGFPDLIGFGRRSLAMDAEEVERWVLYQIGALAALAKADGVSITHVKAHGALYNSAALDPKLAAGIVRATRAFSSEVYLFCPPGSEMDKQATELGVKVVREGFADRGYEPNGLLMKSFFSGCSPYTARTRG